MLSHAQIQQFKIDGYLVMPSLFSHQQIEQLTAQTSEHLASRVPPFELEAEVKYPGAPANTSDAGGQTIRRLRMAHQRGRAFQRIAEHPSLTHSIQQILGGHELFLNPNHHNCVMTKQPEYSSETHWHRDTRYWHFDNKYLINSWVALGNEQKENGCMKILPGSHRWEVRREALDDAQFLITDHPDNASRLPTQRLVELNPGDALLFSAHCFHAAGKNITENPKFSLVFTYHNENTAALPNSNSAQNPAIQIL